MLSSAKRIVIKIGSSLIIGEDNFARHAWLKSLVVDIEKLKADGKEILVVCSGAVALGRKFLDYGTRPIELEEKQAAAACGQPALISLWAQAFAATAVSNNVLYPAQILLTLDDSENRRRFLNARNTLETLLENPKIVPIINENDTVATAELRVGDNDRLAARVAQMAGADLLILFSDIDGLYSENPRVNPDAVFQGEIREITPEIEAMAGGAGSSVGTGGMATKLAAAKIAMGAGCSMVIAKGTENHPLEALLSGGRCTKFVAGESPLSARKHWIAGSLLPSGIVHIDAGAARALQSGKSLLPAGVVKVDGDFERGDAVLINNSENQTIGRGLISYNAEDARRIVGKKSQEIEQILGFKRRDVLIHRDDMVLTYANQNNS